MELMDKLEILADAAKYDAACTSSGLDRAGRPGSIGPVPPKDPHFTEAQDSVVQRPISGVGVSRHALP